MRRGRCPRSAAAGVPREHVRARARCTRGMRCRQCGELLARAVGAAARATAHRRMDLAAAPTSGTPPCARTRPPATRTRWTRREQRRRGARVAVLLPGEMRCHLFDCDNLMGSLAAFDVFISTYAEDADRAACCDRRAGSSLRAVGGRSFGLPPGACTSGTASTASSAADALLASTRTRPLYLAYEHVGSGDRGP